MPKSATSSSPRVAIVYDRANTRYGGAEYLLEVLAQAFPGADLLTSVSHPQASWQKHFNQVKTSFLQRIPFAKTHHQWFLPLMPLAFESLDVDEYEVIISVSSAEAKGVITKPHQLHICYLLTPPRYLYRLDKTYLQTHSWLNWPILKQLSQLFLTCLRWWDETASLRPDVIVTLSQTVEKRIKNTYHRQVKSIIHPPLKPLKPNKQLSDSFSKLPSYFLSVSRLVSYKRLDLVIKSILASNKKLIIVGTGLELNNLQQLAGSSGWTRPVNMNLKTAIDYISSQKPAISFLGSVPESSLASLYQHCQAVISPGIEDFGLVPLEAASFGKPSLIHTQSGVGEVLKPDMAVQIKKQNVAAVTQGIRQLEQKKFDATKLKSLSKQFSPKTFGLRMIKLVYDELS